MTPSNPESQTHPAAAPVQHAATGAAAPASSDLPSGPDRPGAARRWLLVCSVAGLALVLVAGFAGYRIGSASRAPSEGSTDVGFARDMQTHHGQAVQMAMILRDRTTEATLRALADDITTSQQHQAGQMYAWLVQWGLPQTGEDPPMTWMSQGSHDSTPGHTTTGPQPPPAPTGMMGMATTEQIASLQQATGRDAEQLFLRLMIAHHQGGVTMAKAALQQASRPEVRTLAAAIDTAQSAEIDQLQQLLSQRQ